MSEQNLSFSRALELLKQGNRVKRSGWNGKGMWLLLINGKAVKNAINDCYGNPDEPHLAPDVLDAIYMRTAQGQLVPWLASQTDLLSEDWSKA